MLRDDAVVGETCHQAQRRLLRAFLPHVVGHETEQELVAGIEARVGLQGEVDTVVGVIGQQDVTLVAVPHVGGVASGTQTRELTQLAGRGTVLLGLIGQTLGNTLVDGAETLRTAVVVNQRRVEIGTGDAVLLQGGQQVERLVVVALGRIAGMASHGL